MKITPVVRQYKFKTLCAVVTEVQFKFPKRAVNTCIFSGVFVSSKRKLAVSFDFCLGKDDPLLAKYTKGSTDKQRERLAREFLEACDIEFYPNEGRGEEDYHLVLRKGGTVAVLITKA